MANAMAKVAPTDRTMLSDCTLKRFASVGVEPTVLADIYQEEINIAIWRRNISEHLVSSLIDLLAAKPRFGIAMTVSPVSAHARILEAAGDDAPVELVDNVAELVDMFCCLFELKRVGLRLATLDRAMCPRFHVDRVPCRLVTTYHGIATDWLPHDAVDRSKLGHGSNGQSDSVSGLFRLEEDIQHLNCGDVALFKGESWAGNENAGLVHRSPAVPPGNNRLLLTLDFSD